MKRLPIEMIKWRKAINKRIDKIDGQVDIVDNEMSYSYEIGNPVLREKGEKLLMNIENGLIISFQESIETFGLEEVLEIREREAYDSNGDKIEDMSAVVIIELEREDEIDGEKLYKLANALLKEKMEEIRELLYNMYPGNIRYNDNEGRGIEIDRIEEDEIRIQVEIRDRVVNRYNTLSSIEENNDNKK